MIPASYEHLLGSTLDGRYEMQAVLGVGAFGVVFRARDSKTSDLVAVKCLQNAGLNARQRLFLVRELSLHQHSSSHTGVVTIHKIIETRELIFIVLDFCPVGDLFGMITERQRYLGDDALISSVFLQIIDAVTHLHRQGIYHRDLKPENILCEQDGRVTKLADFGLATTDKVSKDFGCGSSFYISPETAGGVFDQLDSYHPGPNDVWALGVILVNLTCGRNPWRTATIQDDTFLAYLRDPNYLERILPISSPCHTILQAIFTIDPRRRVTLPKLREMVARVERWTLSKEEVERAGPGREAAREVAAEDAVCAKALRAKARAEEAARLLAPQAVRQDLGVSRSSSGGFSSCSADSHEASSDSSSSSSGPSNYRPFPISPLSAPSSPSQSSQEYLSPAASLATRSANLTLVSLPELSLKSKVAKAIDRTSEASPPVSPISARFPAPIEQDLTRVQSMVETELGKDLLREEAQDQAKVAEKAAVLFKASDVAQDAPVRPTLGRRMSSFFKGRLAGRAA